MGDAVNTSLSEVAHDSVAQAEQTEVVNSTAPLLEMRNIAKRFGDFYALQSVDLDVYAGEIHALMGENGAGKSTLILSLIHI